MSRVARPFVVLNTNVLVSGFLNPYGAPAAILRLAVRGQIRLVYDARIFAEYTEVLLRPKFRLAEDLLRTVLDMLREQGLGVVALPLPVRLPDPADEPFLEVALAAGREVESFSMPKRQGGIRGKEKGPENFPSKGSRKDRGFEWGEG